MAVIEVMDLRKRYGDLTVLDGVSFSVEEGEIFGILGPNGAGKTTAVECVEGLRRPDGGSIRVLGLDPVGNRRALCEQVGVQLQHTQLPDNLKVWEALDLYASFYPKPGDWRELLVEWGLQDKRDTRFGKLSGGQKQRLFIALALVGNPRVAFLDELTTGLDPQARRATWALIKRIRATGVTVVLVSHFMDEVEELCDRAAIFDQGRIVALDTPAGIVDEIDADHEMRFTLMAGELADLTDLTGLPGVARVTRTGDRVVVTGRGDFATAVTAQLARHHVLVSDLRIDKRTLDDAFVALTGRPLE
ncbi:ABC transporter ATP-binding protein [Dactylosporangium siamense]|uniref:Multidrug ABC transporter ATP-binding protein n=1 Tax=Dactylosporangium siamense TaxID=685454 RepID=A0A919UEM7_9ACTN|nr:ABC transporter ATP-binding protein [Dactylosporangium siamense]GIG52614.1 multidrug ABC transporter ATP-binding protein [Dactylosporangium siamense]